MSIEPKNSGKIDARLLLRWLGIEGAKAGLQQSRLCTVDVLSELAKSLGITVSKSATRTQLVDEIVKLANRRIDKPVDELYRMNREELVRYFEQVEASAEELLELLKEQNVSPHKESRRNLIEFAAQELSETGRFLRIGSSGSKGSDTELS